MRLPSATLVLILATSAASAQSIVGRASVIDGDTLDIRGERVRILDIDAPESGQFCFKKTENLDVGAWPCGQQAALALSDWIGQQTVTCESTKKEANELWAIQAEPDFLRNVMTAPNLVVTEQVTPKENSQVWSRAIKLSTGGLSKHIDGVVKGCDGAKLPEQSKGEGKS